MVKDKIRKWIESESITSTHTISENLYADKVFILAISNLACSIKYKTDTILPEPNPPQSSILGWGSNPCWTTNSQNLTPRDESYFKNRIIDILMASHFDTVLQLYRDSQLEKLV